MVQMAVMHVIDMVAVLQRDVTAGRAVMMGVFGMCEMARHEVFLPLIEAWSSRRGWPLEVCGTLASDSGSAEVFHALIITEMIDISGVGKETREITRVILLKVVVASAVRPKPPLLGPAKATVPTVKSNIARVS